MTNAEVHSLGEELAAMLAAGATTDEIEEWANAYAFARRDLIDLLRLERATTNQLCTPEN
jgi:hypothetical protein